MFRRRYVEKPELNRTRSRLIVYLNCYIKEILQTYFQQETELSYRQIKKVYKNSGTLLTYIANNKKTPILKMMRRVHRRIKRERN